MNTALRVIEVVDREINIPSKASKINVATDLNIEKLIFKIPQYYAGTDLTTLDLVMYIKGVDVSDIVAIRGYELLDGFIVWEFTPQGAMLSKSGYIDIQLSGIKIENDVMSVKWQTKIKENAFYINRSMTDVVDTDVKPLPTELEQYRAEIIALIESVDLDRVIMNITADTKNTIVLHRGDGTQSPVALNVSGGITQEDVNVSIETHNVGATTHADIRKSIADGDKVLDDKVRILSTNVGDVNTLKTTSKVVTGAINEVDDKFSNLSNKISFGKKSFTLAQLDNIPNALGITPTDYSTYTCMVQEPVAPYLYNGAWYEVTEHYYLSTYRVQTAKSSYHTAYTKERKMVNGVWGKWVEYATTDKIDISLTPKTGYTIYENKSYQINNVLYVNTVVKKADSTDFVAGTYVNIITLPYTVSDATLCVNCQVGGFYKGYGTAIATGTSVAVTPVQACQLIRISGLVIL